MTDPKHTDTSRSGDLVAAMKDQIESWEFEDPRETWCKWQHQYAQAADRIEALEAENKRLREENARLPNWLTLKYQKVIHGLAARAELERIADE